MKIVRGIVFGLAVFVAILLIVAAFIKKDYVVVKEVTINKPNQEVFEYVRFLKNQDNYSKWAKMIPAIRKSYRGTDGTFGFVSAWDSDNSDVGKGEQEITKIANGQRIDYDLTTGLADLKAILETRKSQE